MLKNRRISEFAVTLTLSVKIKKLSKEQITINNINKIAAISGFSVGCFINKEVICYQLELGK